MSAKSYLFLLLTLLLANLAEAATYTFRSGGGSSAPVATPNGSPSVCSGSWSRSGGTFICSGTITLAAGDVLAVRTGNESLTNITVVASQSIALNGNTVGTAGNNISLQTSYGSLSASGTNTINGSLSSGSGAITLSSATVSGSVTSNGSIKLTAGSVRGNVYGSNGVTTSGTQISGNVVSSNGAVELGGGSVQGYVSGNGVTTSGTEITGTVTAATGSIKLSGGSVSGLVTSDCCTVTSNGTDLLGGARGHSGLDISGGTIAGSFYANNNPAVFSGVTMTAGSVGGASTITFDNSSLGTASAPVSVAAINGAVTLNASVAYGDFVAPSYSTIQVNSPSVVYGTCTPGSTPFDACRLPPPAGARLAWSMDESTWSGAASEVRDASGNALHGSATNGGYTDGVFPARLPLHGRGTCGYGVVAGGSHVRIADAAPLDFDFAVSMGFWIRPTQTPAANVVLVEKGANYRLELNSSRRLVLTAQFRYSSFFGIGSSSETLTVTSATQLPLNAWTHVGFALELTSAFLVRDQLSGRIFINGELETSGQTSAQYWGQTAANTSELRVGGNGSNGLAGFIDEVRLYQIPLAAADLAALMAERHPCQARGVVHYRLGFSTPMLSCNAIPVTVIACADSNCSTTMATSESIALTPSGAWVGGDQKTFANSDTLTAYLKRQAGTRVLGMSDASYNCSPADCILVIQDSGFVFSNLSPVIAGKPQSAVIQAVKKDEKTEACLPAFNDDVPRVLQFSAAYVTPGAGSRALSVAGVALTPGTDGAPGVSQNVVLTFNEEAKAPIEVIYADAGEVGLKASYVGVANPEAPANNDELLRMEGSTSFVSRPYGLCLQSDALQSNDYGAASSLFPGGVRAGDSFALTIKPVIWTAASDGSPPLQADAICGNPATPNYQQAGIALTVKELNGGHDGVLGVTNYTHRPGGAMVINQSISEVGVFRLQATPPNYLDLDMSHALSQSGRVGRFVPASFLIEDPVVTPSCSGFTYAGLIEKGGPSLQLGKDGQPFAVEGVLSARNRAGGLTRNYTGSFAKLEKDGLAYADDGNGLNLITAGIGSAQLTEGKEDGYLAYKNSDLSFRFDKPQAPYMLAMRVTATDSEGVSGSVVDGVVSTSEPAAPSLLPELRLGLARVGNAHGSELQDLALPFATAFFDGSSYVPNALDNCTMFGAASLGPYQRTGGGSDSPSLEPGSYQAAAGSGQYLVRAPVDGSGGRVMLTYDGVPQWLKHDRDGDGALDKPSGLATFGIYKGPERLIFRREVYR